MKELKRFLHPVNYSLLSDVPPDILTLAPIPPMEQFSKCVLMYVEGHGWMANCRFNLVVKSGSVGKMPFAVESTEVDSLLDLESHLRANCLQAETHMGKSAPEKALLLAFDTETTGLDVSQRLVGGKMEGNVSLVGISLATSPTSGYYIPIGHTGSDGVVNWPMDEVRAFMARIMSDDYHLLYYNAKYDNSVLLAHQIPVNPFFTDLYLVNRLMGNYEFFPVLNQQNSLKVTSEAALGRKMLEIHQVLGMKTKTNIRFDRLPAVNALVYAASDAINTYALYDKWVLKDSEKRNPFQHQRASAQITCQSAYHSMAMIQNGLPVDYPHAYAMLRTVMRRVILLERQLLSFLGDDLNPSSNEQVAKRMVDLLRRSWKKDDESFLKYINDHMGIEVTVRVFKKVGRKVSYRFGSEVAESLLKTLDKHTFLSGEDGDRFRRVCRILVLYRSLCHEKIYYLGLIRNVKKDDRNYSFVNIDLKIEGTDTGRFSNARASGVDRIVWEKSVPKVVYGDGVVTGINAQGFSHAKYVLSKARRIKNMESSPEIESVNMEVEKRLFDELSEV